MKKTAIWLATAVVGILLSSCMGFEQTVGPESFLAPSVSLKQVEVSSGTLYVTLTGEVSGKSTDNLQCGFYFGKNSDLSDASKLSASMSVGRFSTATPSLEYETTYYYKAFISNGKEEICSSVGNFKTGTFDFYAKAGQPYIVQDSKGTVSVTSAVTVASGIELTAQGICYGKDSDISISSDKVESGINKDISVEIKNLDPGTTYFFRAYLTDGVKLTYSDVVSFVPHTLPVIVTEDIRDITSESAVSGGLGLKDNGKAITEKGLVWGTEHAPTVSSATKKSCGDGVSSFSVKISGLKPATTYYVRAYAINADGVAYGDEKSFTTKAVAPTVTTSSAANVTATGATVGGNVTSDGGASVTERGVVWSTSQNPTMSSNKKSSGSGTGSFTATLTGLSVSTTYYVRAYAINSEGTSYGEQISFTTGTVVPGVTTGSVSNVTSTTATVGGNVTSDGGASVTERGVVWSTSQNPTTSSSKKAVGSGTGSFTAELTGLSVATTYYVRAYAINSEGTGYGAQISFTTGSIPVESVSLSLSSLTLKIAESYTLVATVLPADATDKSVTWTSSSPSVATVSSTGQITGKTAGTCVISVKSVNGISASCTVTVRPLEDADTENVDKYDYEFGEAHEYVDLGLSVKWATCNLGASKPEEYGGYYQWAGTKDVSSTSINLDWSNCPYHTGSSSSSGWTKYNTYSSNGTVDNKTVLDSSDDAAHVNWGGSWRMPTDAEWTELMNNCTWTWTTMNGTKGYKVTSKTNGNSIFLPAAACRLYDYLNHAGSYGLYWSSLLNTASPDHAYCVRFNSGDVSRRSSTPRYYGPSVRPVSE